MVIHKIELPTTIAVGGKFFLVDRNVYRYDSFEQYFKGEFIVKNDRLFKCVKDAYGIDPFTDDNHYIELTTGQTISVDLTNLNAPEFSTAPADSVVSFDGYTKKEADAKFATITALPDVSKFANKSDVQKKANSADLTELQNKVKLLEDRVAKLEQASAQASAKA